MAAGKDNGALTGKSALVTGASSGIGAEIARRLATAGADVALTGRSEPRLAEVAEDVRARGSRAVEVVGDLASPDAPSAVVDRAAAELGGIDVLVHSAGTMTLAPFADTSLESLDDQYRVNVRAPFELTQAALPWLREARGSVIFISSMAALAAFAESAAYSASKGAIEAISRQLAIELAPQGIRVNAIAPGEIDTPMNAELYGQNPDYVEEMKRLTPMGRIGLPEDIADVAVFLASDASRFVCGASIPVDGGLLAQ